MRTQFQGIFVAGILSWSLWTGSAAAHEFWIMPDSFRASSGATVDIELQVGEYFTGETIPFTKQFVTSFRHFSSQGTKDLTNDLPASQRNSLALTFTQSGTQMLAIDTHPNQVSLSADKFHAYLHEEGLDAIIKMREAAGTANKPARERYRRHIKTLVQVDGKSDATSLIRTGQRLEIVPVSDPGAKSAGDTLDFKVSFENKPLVNALAKAWYKQAGQIVTVRSRTNQDGVASFTLPFPGAWMINVVHMTPAATTAKVDWESYWSSLTFQLSSNKTK